MKDTWAPEYSNSIKVAKETKVKSDKLGHIIERDLSQNMLRQSKNLARHVKINVLAECGGPWCITFNLMEIILF